MSPQPLRRRAVLLSALVLTGAALGGCASLSTHTTLLSDTSHVGTPYAGARLDLHTLVCFARSVRRDASALLFTPLMAVPLLDLPPSFVLDTLLLPLDVPLEPDRAPLQVGRSSCRLIGM